jgi:hypothetical protein
MSRHALWLRETMAAVRNIRTSSEAMLIERLGLANGMATAGLFLGAISTEEDARLYKLAQNAYQRRRAELNANQHPYARTYQTATKEAA